MHVEESIVCDALDEIPKEFFRGEQEVNASVSLNKDILNVGHVEEVVDDAHVEEPTKSDTTADNIRS